LAETAEFFSFGTNDLTQMTFGFSRDDAGKFLGDYYDKHIYESDPFAHVDVNGVGALIKMAASQGRATRKDIHLGVCGEHGGDPASIEFFQRVGLDYVSCSPFRVPLARLAAAQAAIHADAEKKAASGTVKKTGKKTSKKTVAKKASAKKTVAKKTAVKKTAVKKTVKKTAKKAAAKSAKKTVKKPVKKASVSKKKTRK
jgi:pyruvate,orthophosphate dikinase